MLEGSIRKCVFSIVTILSLNLHENQNIKLRMCKTDENLNRNKAKMTASKRFHLTARLICKRVRIFIDHGSRPPVQTKYIEIIKKLRVQNQSTIDLANRKREY